MPIATDAITIRPAYADDHLALLRLAALDSASAPPPPLLLAEVEGDLRAALSLRDGSSIANPFYPSLALMALLRARAASLKAEPARAVPWRRRGLRLA